jgi:hypothetical protein
VDEPEWTRGEGQKGCGRRQAEQKKNEKFCHKFSNLADKNAFLCL